MGYKEFSLIIRQISSYSILIPLLAGILSFKYLKSKQMNYFFFFICFTFINESILTYTSYNNINNWWIANIYAMIEFTFYSLILYTLIYNRWMKWAIVISIVCLVPYGIRQHLSSDFTAFRTTAYVVSSVLLTFFFGYYLVEKTIRFDERNNYFNSFFFVSLGAIIFFSVSSICMAFLDKLLFTINPYHSVVIFGINNTICNCIFGYAFIHDRIHIKGIR